MTGLGWLTAWAADVPAGDEWLGPRERRVLDGLVAGKRRADWRLGRWAAKRALGGGGAVEILSADDGAPEAWRGDERLPVAFSLSHRAGRALVAVGAPGVLVGCDLERADPRRPLVETLTWTAREAAAKLRREGISIEARDDVSLPPGELALDGAWRALRVVPGERPAVAGWWRAEPGWVMTVVSEPRAGPPRRLGPSLGDPGDQV